MPGKYEGPADRLAKYEKLVATNPDLQRKGATMPYTSRNGHMFSFLDATGTMALRLPDPSRTEFLETYSSSIAEQHGRQMKEYVVVPDHLLENIEELSVWFQQSHEWIGTLKPKPTTS